jgi:predicted 2-oxoglutarate/Fe(II)-dependent dioxygenase YbiX
MFSNFDLYPIRTQLPVTQVQYIPGFLHRHEIDAAVEAARLFQEVNGNIMGNETDQSSLHRASQIRWMEWNDDNWWLYEKIMQASAEINGQLWNFDLFGINEYIQYTEYKNILGNRGHFDWHMDVAHEGLASNRKLSFECVLDDEHEGGDFSILLGPSEYRIKIHKGDAIIYPSYLLTKVYPVYSGTRSSIVSWISGPSFK